MISWVSFWSRGAITQFPEQVLLGELGLHHLINNCLYNIYSREVVNTYNDCIFENYEIRTRHRLIPSGCFNESLFDSCH